jgi:hypothetical protein
VNGFETFVYEGMFYQEGEDAADLSEIKERLDRMADICGFFGPTEAEVLHVRALGAEARCREIEAQVGPRWEE